MQQNLRKTWQITHQCTAVMSHQKNYFLGLVIIHHESYKNSFEIAGREYSGPKNFRSKLQPDIAYSAVQQEANFFYH